jgi:hypothetical protein
MAAQRSAQGFMPSLHEASSHPVKTRQNLNIFSTQSFSDEGCDWWTFTQTCSDWLNISRSDWRKFLWDLGTNEMDQALIQHSRREFI